MPQKHCGPKNEGLLTQEIGGACEVWGKWGADRESLGPPEWESSSYWQLFFPST